MFNLVLSKISIFWYRYWNIWKYSFSTVSKHWYQLHFLTLFSHQSRAHPHCSAEMIICTITVTVKSKTWVISI